MKKELSMAGGMTGNPERIFNDSAVRNRFTPEMIRKISEGDSLLRAYELLFGQREDFTEYSKNIPTWRIIKSPVRLKSDDHFKKKARECKIKICDWSRNLLDNISYSAENNDHHLMSFIRCTNNELGFFNGAYLSETYDHIKNLGYGLCRPVDALYLRLDYLDQPQGESVVVGSETFNDNEGDPSIFFLQHNHNGLHIGNTIARDNTRISAEQVFIFRQKKK